MRTEPATCKPILWIVVPCYNEEEILPQTMRTLELLTIDMTDEGLIDERSQVICVDDCSTDKTWNIIKQAAENATSKIGGLRLGRNSGHQNVLMAGMELSLDMADIVVTIDADLQDDPDVIPLMVKFYEEGTDVVYGVRDDRSCDTIAKRASAQAFYRIMKWLNAPIIANHADFRLMSRQAIEQLTHYDGQQLFLRGIIPQIHLPSKQVFYSRQQRLAGKSKYTLWRMLKLATDGILCIYRGKFGDVIKQNKRELIIQTINIPNKQI